MTKTCTKCGETKDLEDFWACNRNKDKKRADCKICSKKESLIYRNSGKHAENNRRYKDSPRGYLRKTYGNMRDRVTGKLAARKLKSIGKPAGDQYIGLPICTWEEFEKTFLNDPMYLELLEEYTKVPREIRDFKLAPSVDRIIPEMGYEVYNIEWVTLSQNSKNYHIYKRS